jgi:hypothetical protein
VRAALACCLLLACGGRANEGAGHGASGAAGETGIAGTDSSAASGGKQAMDGGAANVPDPANEAGEAAAFGGAAPGAGGAADVPSLIEPGTRVCQDYRDCLGLDCIGKSGKEPSMCSLGCAADDPCAENERCVSGNGLTPACFVRCDVGTECSYPFDCFDPERNGEWICVPAPWTDHW